MKPLRIAIIGAGALGGFYGSRLHAAGAQVFLLARSDAAIARAQGFHCTSPLGDVTIPGSQVVAEAHHLPPVDLGILSLKTVDNHQLPSLLPPALGDHTPLLVLQNGLGVEAEAAAVIGEHRVYGGLSFLCANKIAPATVHHLDYGKVVVGRQPIGDPASDGTLMERLVKTLHAGGVSAECSDDLPAARWHKLVWNIPFNGLCTVLDTTTDQVLACTATRHLAADMMGEVQAAAAACGHHIADAFLKQMMDDTLRMAPYLPSMTLDRRHRRAMEIRHLFDNPLQAAATHGVTMPHTASIAALLTALNDSCD